MKLEKLKPGDVVWSKRRERMGNTTMRRTSVHPIHIVEVDLDKQRVKAHWNSTCNPAQWYYRSSWGKWTYKRPKDK